MNQVWKLEIPTCSVRRQTLSSRRSDESGAGRPRTFRCWHCLQRRYAVCCRTCTNRGERARRRVDTRRWVRGYILQSTHTVPGR